LLLKICRKAEELKIPVGLYGGTEESLEKFIVFLKQEYPKIDIAYAFSPPFRNLSSKEDTAVVGHINQSGAKILFVGIGCPKQECWMSDHKDRLHCVMIGVGAAFDFFSGEKKHAPRWIQKCGMEWVFRFASDPARLWKRYVKHNPRFVYYFARQLIRKKTNKPG
jgi:N-acetylglucosaminyldiphosphoundecaprenol N-acetyl-beta-D-mannosaminyltransferase